jgi:hypothetical protein
MTKYNRPIVVNFTKLQSKNYIYLTVSEGVW